MQNPILKTLSENKASIGSWLNLASPLAAEVLAAAGFQWLTVDAEHAAFDLESAAHTFRAIEARGAIPLARAWDHDPVTAARLLDAGAWGLVFPHVSTVQQAEQLVRAVRYPPVGNRSLGTGRCTTLSPDYYKVANSQILCIPQIEDMEGVENAEAIASVEGVDIGFLGPADLASSMGVPSGHADHEAAIGRVREACARVGKPSGIPVMSAAAARQRISEGFRFIDLSNDMRMLRDIVNRELQAVSGESEV